MSKYNTALIMCIIMMCITGCSKEIETDTHKIEYETHEHKDLFIELTKNEEVVIEDTYVEVEDTLPNPNDEYKGVYESNINVNIDNLMSMDINQSWFNIPENRMFQESTYQWVAYAIYTYYNGNVPETFKFDVSTDIISSETNMIFTVAVYSENKQLNILLDTHNNEIIVNEIY